MEVGAEIRARPPVRPAVPGSPSWAPGKKGAPGRARYGPPDDAPGRPGSREGVVQPVLAQVHPGEDHFPVAQAGQLMKGRQHRGGVQAAAGAPHLGHDAVAALVVAALLDLEPGPGVAGGLVDFPGLEGTYCGEISHPEPLARALPRSATACGNWTSPPSRSPGGQGEGESVRSSPTRQPLPIQRGRRIRRVNQ